MTVSRRSRRLMDAIPRVKALFRNLANEENTFPLFSPQVQQMVWKTVPINPAREASILVSLVSYEGQPSLLFTTRSSELPSHASEVSFPGGHFDAKTDNSLEDTAVREAQEELLGDYPWDSVEIIGRATPLPSITGTPVTPVIAILPHEIDDNTFPGCPKEVEDIFCVSLEELLEIESTEPSERFRSNIPVFPTKNGKRIWGLTAVVTRPLLHKILVPAILQGDSSS